ncbi:MAG: hypothetical protein V1766_07965 [Pseudomonadota bacterium]
MKAYATKLIDFIETKSEEMARQWAADVRKNHRTPSYHVIPEEKVIPQAIFFYTHFRQMFFTKNPYESAKAFFARYAEERYREKIPLQEAIYALILMRRHLWLYAEFRTAYETSVDLHQMAESLNRTILMFDYAMYQITEKYQELITRDVDRKLGAVQTLRMEYPAGRKQGLFKAGLMGVFLLIACILTYYYHANLGEGVIFTHLFYIPIILASIWWGKKGILIALFLGILIIISHALFLKGMPFTDDIIRAVMFVLTGFVVARLMEGLKKVEDLFRTLTT